MFARIQGSPVACIKQEVKITDHSGLVGLILHEPVMSYTLLNSCRPHFIGPNGGEPT